MAVRTGHPRRRARARRSVHRVHGRQRQRRKGTAPHLHVRVCTVPDGTPIDPYTSLRLAQGLPGNGQCSYPSTPDAHPSRAAGSGLLDRWPGRRRCTRTATLRVYQATNATQTVSWGHVRVVRDGSDAERSRILVDRRRGPSGRVRRCTPARRRVEDSAGRADHRHDADRDRQRLLVARGRRRHLSFGDATFFGSTGAMRLNAPVVGMSAAPGGQGYWLLAATAASSASATRASRFDRLR